MASRIIRDSCLTSATLDQLSAEAERLFFRLTVVVDDKGRFDADPRVILARCFPLKAGKWKAEKVKSWRDELASSGAIVLYENGTPEKVYGYFQNWTKYQRTYGHASKFPQPPAQSGTPPRAPGDPRSDPRSEIRDDRTENREHRSTPQTPVLSVIDALKAFTITPELQAWAEAFGIPNPEDYLDEFKDYWLSVDGKRKGGRPVKDWEATFRNRLRELKAMGRLHSRAPGVGR